MILVRCSNTRANGFRCTQYLGDMDVDKPGVTVRHHCKNCKITWEHTVGLDSIVRRRLVPADEIEVAPIPVITVIDKD